MTSQAQITANRKNAQSSTGPKTEEGKAASSANALDHGAYSDRHDPITASILREDPDEIEELIEAIISELDPQTPLEQVGAQTVATRVLNRIRVDRLTAPLMDGCELSDVAQFSIGTARNEVEFAQRLSAALDVLEERSEASIHWTQMVFDLLEHVHPERPFSLSQVWPDGEERGPDTIEEWKSKFDELIKSSFDSIEEARSFAVYRYSSSYDHAVAEERTARSMQAKQLLEEFERTTRLNDHVDRGFDRAMASLERIRARSDKERPASEQDPRNEPNPNM
jgi:hypothetical protein